MSYIGQSLARIRTGSRRHWIESEIEDRLVTRCGREMKVMLHGKGMTPAKGYPICKRCIVW